MPSANTSARLVCLGMLLWLAPAHGAGMAALDGAWRAGSGSICHAAAAAAEASLRVPDAFLSAIAKVESGRSDKATGAIAPWPWTVNAEGVGSFYDSKAAAIAAVSALQARGVRSIDVGCLQVNLLQHPEAFASLDQAFDPNANALYAAGFLVALFHQLGSWPLAAAAYHSQTPTLGAPYERRVLAEWAIPDNAAAAQPRQHSAKADAARGDKAEAALLQPAVPHGATSSSPFGTAPVMGGAVQPGNHPNLPPGRSLAAYRLLPVRLAMRSPG